MPGLIRYLDVYPPTGFADRCWGSELEDAVARSARCVTELYTEALESLPVPAPRSWLRVVLGDPHAGDPSLVNASVNVDPPGDREWGAIGMVPAMLELTPRSRAEVVLACVHGLMLRLADARGWDPQQLEQCRRHVEHSDFTYAWDSPWKASPNRRFRARFRARLPVDDGFSRVRLEIADREGAVLAVSDEAVGFCTSEGLRRSAAALRWRGSERVDVVPFIGLASHDRGGLLALVAEGAAWRSVVRQHTTVRQPASGSRVGLEVEVRGRGVTAAEDPPRISVIGGGPMNGVPDAYDDALDRGLRSFADRPGQEWWYGAGLRELRVFYQFDAAAVRVRARRTGVVLTVWIDRPVDTIRPPYDELAAVDVQALVDLVRRRTALPPHPTLGPGRPHT